MNEKTIKEKIINRLIWKSLLISILCFIPAFLYSAIVGRTTKSVTHTDDKKSDENYHLYGWDQTKLIKTFEDTNNGARQYLTAKYKNKKLAKDITDKASEEFKSLVLELPNIGGEKNIDTEFIPIAAWYLSYYRAMKPHGKNAEDVGRMIYDLNQVVWKHYPETKAKTVCRAFFSENGKRKYKEMAKWTQKKHYPANWVMEYVSGEDEDFDFGYNYTHCGVCLYLNAYDAVELAPYVCLNDFIESKALGTGLHRTKTLAASDNECNFRFKKGRKVTQNWNTEIQKIRERSKAGRLFHSKI